MTARRDAGQTSFVPAKVLRRLLQEQPTPFYLYDETMLREACEKLRLAFSWNAGFTPVFPVPNEPEPCRFADSGERRRAAAVREPEAELRLARRADADGQRIIYAPLQSTKELAAMPTHRRGAAGGRGACTSAAAARAGLSERQSGRSVVSERKNGLEF